MKAGLAAVVGRPNVGKSSLVNRLVGSKVSIISTRPQTTRATIRGVLHGDGFQLVLVDTPGLHRPRMAVGERLNRQVHGSLADADLVLMVIDATQPIGPGDRLVAEAAGGIGRQVVLAVNKVDRARPPQIARQLSTAAEWDFSAYVPVSALTGQGVDVLLAEVVRRLPTGDPLFPPEQVTDRPEDFQVAELIREKFLDRLEDELPHSVVVRVESIEDQGSHIRVEADVIVERKSQKGIIIGAGGQLLGAAGAEARIELEERWQRPVHLELRVRVEDDWQRRPQLLDRLGFAEH
ncbi:MAG TPA: GTPase Era [Acidimicrobiia bacterium]|nr:GTPase Era [Acidimicrobiia bacterium]